MAATRSEISQWFDTAKAVGATHMLIKCASMEKPALCCYPAFVLPHEDPHEMNEKNRDRLMECYAMHLDKDAQMAEHRAYHFEQENA